MSSLKHSAIRTIIVIVALAYHWGIGMTTGEVLYDEEPLSASSIFERNIGSFVSEIDSAFSGDFSSMFSGDWEFPTSYPSLPPINSPTLQPATPPTLIPSSIPTTSPLIDFRAYTGDPLYTVFTSRVASASSSLLYKSFHYKGFAIGGGNAACREWESFTGNALTIPVEGVDFVSISIASGYRASNIADMQNDLFSCRATAAVSVISNGLIKDEAFVVECDGHEWRYSSCASNTNKVLCIDCVADFRGCYDFPSIVVNPCRTGDMHEVYYSVVEVEFIREAVYPTITGTAVETKGYAAVVTLNASSEGLVYCAAYRVNTLSLRDARRIKVDGTDGTLVVNPYGTNGSTTSVLYIYDLAPSTKYEVYCYAEDFIGNAMTIEEILQTRVTFETNCCRDILLLRNYTSVLEYSPPEISESEFEFRLNAYPEALVELLITLTPQMCAAGESFGNETAIATPNAFIFTNESISLTGLFVVRGDPGCYELTIYSNDSSYESVSAPLTILPSGADFPPPSLSKARFSNDGRKIWVHLTSDADPTLSSINFFYAKSFSCSLLLSYPGVGNSKCVWQSKSVVAVTLAYDSEEYVQPNDILTLKPGILRAACLDDRNCENYELNHMSSVAIMKPLSAVYPVASLSTNAQIVSTCSSLDLDPTQSTNKGGTGRPWEQVSWSVSGSGTNNISAVLAILHENTDDTRSAITIPSNLLQKGELSVVLRVKNFLGRSSVVQVNVQIVDEDVLATKIFGSAIRDLYVWQELELYADCQRVSCNSGAAASNISASVLYEWTVFKGAEYLPSLKSTSNDPRAFKLQPHTLDLNSFYTIAVTARARDTDRSNTGAFKVVVRTVPSSHVDAVISGGDYFTVSRSDIIELDGSKSTIKDSPSSLDTAVDWSCVQLSPVYGASCNGVIFASKVIQHLNASDFVYNNLQLEDFRFRFTLRVTAFDGSYDEASTTVIITSDSVPIVSFDSIAEKYGTESNIILSAGIYSNVSILAGWNSTDVDVKGIATTGVVKSISRGVPLIFYLGISVEKLFPGRTYSFQLSAQTIGGSSDRTLSQLSIIINEPPANGYIESIPSSGYSLNTSFFIRAAEWDDDAEDLPLKYTIVSYTEDANKPKMLKGSTDVPSVTTVLQQGLASMNHFVTCVVHVSDIYGSVGSSATTVVVEPLLSIPSTKTVPLLFDRAFKESNIDDVTAIANSLLEYLNSAECIAAPSCEGLNRLPCKSTPHTCGECIQGYSGIMGDSNDECVADDMYENRRLTTTKLYLGDTCMPGDNCIGGYCSGGICVPQIKECGASCSLRGTCRYYDRMGDPLPVDEKCLSSDPHCTAQCSCGDSFYGKDCSLTQLEYEESRSLRETMCSTLLDAMRFQDTSSDVIFSRAGLVYELMFDPSLVTPEALVNCAYVVTGSIVNSSSTLTSELHSHMIVEALSRIANLAYLMSDYDLNLISDAVTAIVSSNQERLATGSAPVTFVSTNIRWAIFKSYGADVDRKSLSSPVTVYENAVQAGETISVSYESSEFDPSASYGGSIILNKMYSLFKSSENLTSDAFQVGFIDFSDSGGGSQTITIVIPNYESLDYIREIEVSDLVECGLSSTGEAYNIAINCNGTDFLEHSAHNILCPGNRIANVSYQCPAYQTFPQCMSFDGTSFAVDPFCYVVNNTNSTVSCACTTESLVTTRALSQRRLSMETASHQVLTVAASVGSSNGSFTYVYQNEPSSNATSSENDRTWSAVVIASFTFSVSVFVFSLLFLYLMEDSMRIAPTRKNESGMSVFEFFSAALPIQLSDKSTFSRFYYKIRESHPLLGLLYGNDSHYKLSRLGALVVAVFTVDTIWALFTLIDDDSCDDYDSPSSCQSEKRELISFGDGEAACEWNSITAKCSYAEPTINFPRVIILSMLIVVLVIPVSATLDWCLMSIRNYYVSNKLYGVEKNRSNKIYAIDSDIEKGMTSKQVYRSTSRETLKSWESLKSKLSVGGRLNLMRRRLDSVTVSDEVYFVHTVHPSPKWSFSDRVSLPPGGSSLEGSDAWADRLVSIARSEVFPIKADISSITESEYKQVVMLQHFLVHSCVGWKRPLAAFHLTASGMFDSKRRVDKWVYILSWCIVTTFILCAAFLVFYYAAAMDPAAVKLWLVAASVSLVGKLFVVDLLYVLVMHIGVASVIRHDVIRLHHRLHDFGERIMNRGFTTISLFNQLVQSLNPVCRLARIRPQYALSRLLMQLNDYDIPASYASRPPYSSAMCQCCMAVFVALCSLPYRMTVVLVEAAISVAVACVLVFLYNMSKISIAIPISLVIVIAIGVCFLIYLKFRSQVSYPYETPMKRNRRRMVHYRALILLDRHGKNMVSTSYHREENVKQEAALAFPIPRAIRAENGPISTAPKVEPASQKPSDSLQIDVSDAATQGPSSGKVSSPVAQSGLRLSDLVSALSKSPNKGSLKVNAPSSGKAEFSEGDSHTPMLRHEFSAPQAKLCELADMTATTTEPTFAVVEEDEGPLKDDKLAVEIPPEIAKILDSDSSDEEVFLPPSDPLVPHSVPRRVYAPDEEEWLKVEMSLRGARGRLEPLTPLPNGVTSNTPKNAEVRDRSGNGKASNHRSRKKEKEGVRKLSSKKRKKKSE